MNVTRYNLIPMTHHVWISHYHRACMGCTGLLDKFGSVSHMYYGEDYVSTIYCIVSLHYEVEFHHLNKHTHRISKISCEISCIRGPTWRFVIKVHQGRQQGNITGSYDPSVLSGCSVSLVSFNLKITIMNILKIIFKL